MIERENFVWGVRLVARPFPTGDHQSLMIQSEVNNYKHGRGSEIRITFSGTSLTPLRIIDAQTWREALGAVIDATRAVTAEMKTAYLKAAEKPAAKAKPAKRPTKKG